MPRLFALLLCLFAAATPAFAMPSGVAGAPVAAPSSWEDIVAKARGQMVLFNGSGADEKVNAFIAWVAERMQQEHGVFVRHVKIPDMGAVVTRILAERSIRKDTNGLTDLLYADAAALAPLEEQKLLYGPFTQVLPTAQTAEGAFTLPFATAGTGAVLAIPYNARNKEGAIVLANFLNSPEARAKAQGIAGR